MTKLTVIKNAFHCRELSAKPTINNRPQHHKNMKIIKAVICAVALTAVFITSKADLVLNVSATGQFQKAYYPGSNVATTVTLAINNKYIYNIISNAVANTGYWAINDCIAPTNLPANGYIAYNPTNYDGTVYGVFYVTNKSGFYYPLSGTDTNGQYYSWIELDSQNFYYSYRNDNYYADIYPGWGGFNGVNSYNVNSKTNGTEIATSTALFYVHDDPYCYNDTQSPPVIWGNPGQGNGDDINGNNANAIEVRGILTATLALNSASATVSSYSMTGSGNVTYAPNLSGIGEQWGDLVKTATVKFAK